MSKLREVRYRSGKNPDGKMKTAAWRAANAVHPGECYRRAELMCKGAKFIGSFRQWCLQSHVATSVTPRSWTVERYPPKREKTCAARLSADIADEPEPISFGSIATSLFADKWVGVRTPPPRLTFTVSDPY